MTTKTNTNKQLKNINKLGKLPVWNLEDLYDSTGGKKISSDLDFIEKSVKKFEKKYERKIKNLKSEQLLKAIIELEKIYEKINRIMSYAHLLYAENIENENNKIFFQQMQEKINKYSSFLIFFPLELNNIDNRSLIKLLKNKKLKKFETWITNARAFKPHQLNKKLEKLFQDKSITSTNAWIRFFDEIIASLYFPFKKQKLTSAEILNLLSDNDPLTRKKAAKSIGDVLGQNVKIFATITNTLAKDKSINDEWRKYPNPIRSRNLSNVIEDEVVEALSHAVTSSYPNLSHRYYALKAKWFGVKSLKYWDRNAPLPFQSKKRFSWDDAKIIINDSYSSFNSHIGSIVKKFFDESWIHAPVVRGKSPGAFSAGTVPCVHPYILVNYQGKIRDISTLAHELGHGIHQYLAGKKQGYFNASTPLT